MRYKLCEVWMPFDSEIILPKDVIIIESKMKYGGVLITYLEPLEDE